METKKTNLVARTVFIFKRSRASSSADTTEPTTSMLTTTVTGHPPRN